MKNALIQAVSGINPMTPEAVPIMVARMVDRGDSVDRIFSTLAQKYPELYTAQNTKLRDALQPDTYVSVTHKKVLLFDGGEELRQWPR